MFPPNEAAYNDTFPEDGRQVKIAILGAESTGKSQLASALTASLQSRGQTASQVNEYLREWCDAHSRTPRASEQLLIAHKQVQRVNEHASKPNRFVIADTTAFMTAVYSELLFKDASLYDFAAAHQRSYDVTLVTGLDLPWVTDGIQRDGPHARERTDGLLRTALERASLPYRVVYGTGRARLENALRAIDAIHTVDATFSIANYSIRTSEKDNISRQNQPETGVQARSAVWTWPCEKCSDPECEHRLFSQLLS